jgi:hypothetical protein
MAGIRARRGDARPSFEPQVVPLPAGLSFTALKAKQRQVRQGFSESLTLRVHRSISWLGRAQKEADDPDLRFILLWIGFNAAYAGDLGADIDSERGAFRNFFETLVGLDKDERIYKAVWLRFPHEIRVLLANRYVFAPFWRHQNGSAGHADWAERLAASQRRIGTAMAKQDTVTVLALVFDRLYVLRNQLVHGGSTWASAVNRQQVRDGAAVLAWLLPVFIDLMMDNPDRDWGRPFYPVIAD